MKKLLFLLASCAVASLVHGQTTIVLDNFNQGTASGSTDNLSVSWVGNVTQNLTTITVGGTAKDENGWGVFNQNINATSVTTGGHSFITITAQRDAGNVAPTLVISFDDNQGNTVTNVFNVPTSAFAVGVLTTVSIPVVWTGGFDFTSIADWSIGGGGVGINVFHMTFDNLALTSVAAVPEPSTYALLTVGLGTLVLGLRRKRRA